MSNGKFLPVLFKALSMLTASQSLGQLDLVL